MSTYSARSHPGTTDLKIGAWFRRLSTFARTDRLTTSRLLIIGALIAFESFNYGTTEFALTDLLGDLRFAGLRWSTILALAFCAMDFAGIARLFSPTREEQEPTTVWYLLGAWLLASTMNAMLSWWAVSLALLGHQGLGNEILGREALLSGVPIFVAILVWLIRVLIIGIFTLRGDHIFARKRARPKLSILQSRKQTKSDDFQSSGESVQRRPARPAPKPVHASHRENRFDQQPLAASPPKRQ
jgi:hypothetical protein